MVLDLGMVDLLEVHLGFLVSALVMHLCDTPAVTALLPRCSACNTVACRGHGRLLASGTSTAGTLSGGASPAVCALLIFCSDGVLGLLPAFATTMLSMCVPPMTSRTRWSWLQTGHHRSLLTSDQKGTHAPAPPDTGVCVLLPPSNACSR